MPAQREPSQALAVRAFATALTAMRGKTSKNHLADVLGYTAQFIGQVEACKNLPSEKFAQDLDSHFDSGSLFADLWRLVDETRDEIHLPPGFSDFLERETQASTLYIFCAMVVHGLFQTRSYACELLAAGRAPDEIEHLVNKRMERQEILTRDTPPQIVAVFDEAAVRRMVGADDMMREQVSRLIEVAEMPNITLHIVSAKKGAHPGVMGAFTILRFDDAPDMVYTEGHLGGDLTDHTPAVRGHALSFDLIRGAAMPADESLKLLRAVLESQ